MCATVADNQTSRSLASLEPEQSPPASWDNGHTSAPRRTFEMGRGRGRDSGAAGGGGGRGAGRSGGAAIPPPSGLYSSSPAGVSIPPPPSLYSSSPVGSDARNRVQAGAAAPQPKHAGGNTGLGFQRSQPPPPARRPPPPPASAAPTVPLQVALQMASPFINIDYDRDGVWKVRARHSVGAAAAAAAVARREEGRGKRALRQHAWPACQSGKPGCTLSINRPYI